MEEPLGMAGMLGQYVRPALVLICAMLVFNLPIVIYKIGLLKSTILYLLFCNDKKWKRTSDPGAVFGPHISAGKPIERKKIYFVRHGESTWNDTFNKGNHRSTAVFILGFLPGVVKAVLFEIYLVLSGKMDSWFYDSPLSQVGLKQVEELAVFMERDPPETDEEIIKILRADPGAKPSKFVCSNLRRAISTLAGGFRERLGRRKVDKILVLPCLQEMSRNPDAQSITPAHTPIQASWMEKGSKVCNFDDILRKHVDTSLHTGNKPIRGSGYDRMIQFCKFVFSNAVREEHVIAGGHSLYFKSFFQCFLPASVDHVAKNKKIKNGGVVCFELMKAKTQYGDQFMIDPASVRVIYLGF
ncbi:expressed unknown protein [Seminavis robusta]|uniref:Uncharacterized protein n=1 Tax=Seminavis robusta TaxID=568900 RepID=A0A9N8DQB1_9STRA|nr:expressed unknown protein [Seminavis robusta]|eukprot:Sro182_g079410.1 n/a (356) ;mRNA; r:62452-63865